MQIKTRAKKTRQPSQPESVFLNFKKFKPLTENQSISYQEFLNNKNLMMYGFPGTGKTFLACAFAVEALMKGTVRQIRIIRSAVPSRDMGFLPGTEAEKMEVFERPYHSIFSTILQRGDAYEVLKKHGQIVFESSSYLRGVTYDDTFIIIDEFQSMSFHELSSIITRTGEESKIIFCGDINQCDLNKKDSGFTLFKEVLSEMKKYFTMIEMGIEDIVRSDLVRDFIIASERLKIS